MNRALLILAAGLYAIPAHSQTAPAVLASENFEVLPPEAERVTEFPSRDGQYRTLASGRFTGWAGAGVVRLSHLPGVGVERSAGLLVTPAEGADDTVYYVASYGPLPLAGRTGGTLLADDISALRFAFAVRVPVGRALNVSIGLVGPRELESETWDSRLRLPKVVGTGSFSQIVVNGHDFPDKQIQAFLVTARKLGERRLRVAVQWYVDDAPNWPPGDSFTLDDVELSISR